MSKELEKEYLEDLDHYDEGMGIHSTSYKKCKERLIRLAQIDSSKPSEALEKVNKVLESCYEYEKKVGKNAIVHISKEPLIEIQQALIKTQEQEKVLNELLMLINDLEPTFNLKGMVSIDDENLGTFIKNYFLDNASDILKRYLEK